ncbi:hypothetical protein SteCoe_3105 [Stentor coeruleus]|uniref:Uncharacterized protein n=1 Tax=Stentor coeruleus TaxID=5963 RepID=A0A1R2CY18_9CILI|nr:hypothetical protein SteCoe_3105 [Stentor coeruleus]
MIKRLFSYPKKILDVIPSLPLQTTPAETIMALWHNIHLENQKAVVKTISKLQYQIIINRISVCPTFLFPVSIKSNKITLISEKIEEKCWGFSNIEDEDSNVIMILRMFDEVAQDKLIVPMRGDIIDENLVKKDAEFIMQQFIDYYFDEELFEKYVKVFNHNFEEFDYKGFIEGYFQNN